VTFNAARVINGYSRSGRLVWPIYDFVLQVPDGAGWKDVPGTKTAGNEKFDWHARFAPVTADRVRLYVTAAEQDTTRIFEFEIYNVPAK